MSRRKQVLNTYGRHRKRVVSVDIWSNVENQNNEDVFCSASSRSISGCNSSESFISAETATLPPQASSASDASLFKSRERQESVKEQKPPRKKNTRNKNRSVEHEVIDFSEIENFSLIVSDGSPPPALKKPPAHTTSTPHLAGYGHRRIPLSPLPSDLSCFVTADESALSTALKETTSKFSALDLSSIVESCDHSKSNVSYDPSRDMFESMEQLPVQSSSGLSASQSCVSSLAYDADMEALSKTSTLSLLSNIPEENEEPATPDHNHSASKILDENTPNDCVMRADMDSFRESLSPTRKHQVPAKERVLELCNQDDVMPFSKCIPPTVLKKCKKVGEGVYAEVFKTERRKAAVALKIIPIEGNFLVNQEQQKTFEEIIPEIIISKELSALHNGDKFLSENFVLVKDVYLVKGSYPKKLLDEWDVYDQNYTSENDRPDIFPRSQLFIIFEFENAGSALESFKFNNTNEIDSVMKQITSALAVSESSLHFEHRDLHVGNVLIKRTDETSMRCKISDHSFSISTHGVKVSIIDFTLSRLSKDGCSVYTDLSTDATLFEGHGDYQFDIYRKMKTLNQNNWKKFHPQTNIFWIHYLSKFLIDNTSHPSSHLSELSEQILQYSSAKQLFSAEYFRNL